MLHFHGVSPRTRPTALSAMTLPPKQDETGRCVGNSPRVHLGWGVALGTGHTFWEIPLFLDSTMGLSKGSVFCF